MNREPQLHITITYYIGSSRIHIYYKILLKQVYRHHKASYHKQQEQDCN